MALPALRQPKIVLNQDNSHLSSPLEKEYVILTMKEDKKLVVTKDSYNGILSTGGFYKCVFCRTLLDLNHGAKEQHIRSVKHGETMAKHPHVGEFSHNLIRKLTEDDTTYCTLCNVIVESVKLMKHICSGVHLQELERAEARAFSYKAYE